jgi:hypothetical protein
VAGPETVGERLGELLIAATFRGPPDCGNGGYVCGAIARWVEGPAAVMLRAPPPLETPLDLWRQADGGLRLATGEGATIALAHSAAPTELDPVREAPSYSEAVAAGRRFPGLHRDFHSVCFCCRRHPPGSGVQAFVGQLEGRPEGEVAGAWAPEPQFADADGLIRPEMIWAALDCPGSVAWVLDTEGQGGALGAMTCEIHRRPTVREPCIIAAWRLGAERRKRFSGTALYSASGQVLASSRQIWIFPTAV